MKILKKISLWLMTFSVAVLAIRYALPEHPWIVVVAYFVFTPFIDRGIKAIVDKEGNTLILGVEFKDFMTPWIAFWGLAGIAISYWQAQNQLSIQKRQELDNNFYIYVKHLEDQNVVFRNKAINELYMIAYQHPDYYLQSVCDAFCNHIRSFTSDSVYKKDNSIKPSNDVQKTIDLLFKEYEHSLIFGKLRKSLDGSYLYGADFENAILTRVDLSDATLSKANFTSAKLYDVHFRDAKLNDRVNFENAFIDSVNFRHNTLTNVNFYKSKIKTGRFFNTRLTSVTFDSAYIHVANFDQAKMINVYFRGADLTDVSFRRDSLTNVYFTGAKLNNVDFWNAKLEKDKVDFTDTDLENIPYAEITRFGRSQELTKPNQKNRP